MFCAGGDERDPKYTGKYKSDPGTRGDYSPLQLSFPHRMHVPGVKQQIGAFCYHFWSKAMPKLSYYQKKDAPCVLEQVESKKERRNILKAVRATEVHMVLSGIAMGSLQTLSVTSVGILTSDQLRYQRTPSRGRVSEGALMVHLRKYFFLFMEKQPELHITQIIRKQQDTSGIYWDSLAS